MSRLPKVDNSKEARQARSIRALQQEVDELEKEKLEYATIAYMDAKADCKKIVDNIQQKVKELEDEKQNNFDKGFILAIAELIRQHDRMKIEKIWVKYIKETKDESK